jgi:hypothetical protein
MCTRAVVQFMKENGNKVYNKVKVKKHGKMALSILVSIIKALNMVSACMNGTSWAPGILACGVITK